MGFIRKEKFSLHHTNVGQFHSSQWSKSGTTTLGYVIYRVVLASLMVAGIVAHIVKFSETNPGHKWLIYMTNQGITLLTLHYVLYALIVISNYLLPRGFTYTGSLPLIYKISWGLQNMSSSAAIFITIIYWAILHPIVLKEGLMSGAYYQFLNVFLHLLNTLSYLLDIFITARPTRIHHFYWPIVFGLWYMIFSIIYWAAGGTGRCYCETATVLFNTTTALTSGTSVATSTTTLLTSTTTTILQNITSTTSIPTTTTITPECPEICDAFIYPILDWGDKPLLAIGMIIGGVLVMPLIQTFWWSCYKLRVWISDRFHGPRSSMSSSFVSQDQIAMSQEKTIVK